MLKNKSAQPIHTSFDELRDELKGNYYGPKNKTTPNDKQQVKPRQVPQKEKD